MAGILLIADTAVDGAFAMVFPFIGEVGLQTTRPDLFSTTPGTPGRVNVYVGENGAWVVENKSGVQRVFVRYELQPRFGNDEPDMSVWEAALDNIPDL